MKGTAETGLLCTLLPGGPSPERAWGGASSITTEARQGEVHLEVAEERGLCGQKQRDLRSTKEANVETS